MKTSKEQEVYKPYFPGIYELVLAYYSKAMDNNHDMQLEYLEKTKALCVTLSTLKTAGVLPPFFVKNFRWDIKVAKDAVDKKVVTQLTSEQSQVRQMLYNLIQELGE